VLSDNKFYNGSNFEADVMVYNDYYPFGMPMPGRNMNLGDYRFGFNGKENDNEVLGKGRWQDYGERMYRPDLARFFSPDPIIIYQRKYPELSSYQFASNRPIVAIDLDGLEAYDVNGNIITIHATYVVFKNGSGSPSNIEQVIQLSKLNWRKLNKELLKKDYLLHIYFDENGNVKSVTNGKEKFKIQFDINIRVIDNPNSEEFKEIQKDETFAGVYLFGNNVEFQNEIYKIDDSNDELANTKTNDKLGYHKEVILFKSADVLFNTEIHEVGHSLGLSHLGVNPSFKQDSKFDGLFYLDALNLKNFTSKKGSTYNSSGMMKYANSNGDSAPSKTQTLNLLNANPGGKKQ
jgi:RHS repeat-associated protein